MVPPEKFTMKVVTKRFGKEDPIKDTEIMQRTFNRLRGNALVPKGVFRFSSMKEADQWMMEKIMNTHGLLSSRT